MTAQVKALVYEASCRVNLTSELLTRPSWNEQSLAFCVHMCRYLHQWQGKEPFTQERHLKQKLEETIKKAGKGMCFLTTCHTVHMRLLFHRSVTTFCSLFVCFFVLSNHAFVPSKQYDQPNAVTIQSEMSAEVGLMSL